MDISDLLTDFRLQQPDITLRHPHAISVHIEWLNYNDVGNVAFQCLVHYLKAKKLGEFERSGDFYDPIAYREYSRIYLDEEGDEHEEFPNSRIYYVKREEPLRDLVLMSLLEPSQFGEIYVDRIVALLKRLGVTRYQVIGAIGSSVPHTRPIIVNGRNNDPELMEKLKKIGVRESTGNYYPRPASVFSMIAPRLRKDDITTVSLVANLPKYIGIGGDYTGVHSVLRTLSQLENIGIPLDELEIAGRQQYDELSKHAHTNPQLSEMVKELENVYDSRVQGYAQEHTPTRLPHSIEEFLKHLSTN